MGCDGFNALMDQMTKNFADCQTLDDFEQLFPPRDLPAGTEVTRIAPSPTGMPHIGTAMQAVLDRALADKTKGLFLLRIEDTDRARTVPGALEAIIDGLKWLNMVPDEGPTFGGSYGPYIQSERVPLYQVAARHLVKTGHAYHCFCTAERLEMVRKTQTANHQSPKYDGHCRTLGAEEVAARVAKGEKNVIRLKVPAGRSFTIHDEVRGDITFDATVIDDSVLLKSDGFPTYHLAAPVDDHFMRITTVVRGEEWVPSTPKHLLVFESFGWQAPKFLHTVLLRDNQKHKLSKRSGDTSLTWFKRQGILPEALCNFLYRVMWAHPEGKDIYPMAEFAEKLDVKALPSTGPVADMDLLLFVNRSYIAAMSDADRAAAFNHYLDFLITHNLTASDTIKPNVDANETDPDMLRSLQVAITKDQDYATRVMAVEPARHERMADIIFNCGYFFDDLFKPITSTHFAKECPDPVLRRQILTLFRQRYTSDDQAAAITDILKAIAAELTLKERMVFMTTRIAVTGRDRTPPLHDIALVLGVARVHARLDHALRLLS